MNIVRKRTMDGNRNDIARCSALSLKAKGLYMLIETYIEDGEIKKSLLMNQCKEGERGFDSAWNELKHKGYLKLHVYPVGRDMFRYEYELLDAPDISDGVYLYRYDKNGNVTSTNKNQK